MYYSDTEACFAKENKCWVIKRLCWLADGSAGAFVEEVHRRRGEADEEDAAESGRFSQREHQSHLFEYWFHWPLLAAGSLRALNSCLCSVARRGEWSEADGWCRADVLPARHQQADLGNAEKIQQREADHFQHLPVLPEGNATLQQITSNPLVLPSNSVFLFFQEAYDNVTVDIELSRREGWFFGAKLVRGAYMYQERDRAKEIGYEDPINPDYEATNRMYHK